MPRMDCVREPFSTVSKDSWYLVLNRHSSEFGRRVTTVKQI
eukprot:CAMPEP_0194602592 /NCGR_PEP_ID=MMETSP0292-20121207/29748_1 /TAXON_ID=39354 /ORGANISM="Heterosigma akashiwo, Strain CCMP2393" /LENGTH=40 /DNA_ID= /DNA_START= /DNA_END= /DNA_ORIENTATION=